MPIVDRYAPSPTSDLHLGNLRTALAGWLLTRREEGRWLLRVEDVNKGVMYLRWGAADSGFESDRAAMEAAIAPV